MDDVKRKKGILNRMSRLIGHAESNKGLIENDTYCFDVINQNLAVIFALHKVNEELLSNHLRTCVKKTMRSNDQEKQEKVIEEILTIYKRAKI